MILISPILRIIARIATLLLYFFTILCCFGGYISPSITPVGSILTIGMPYIVTFCAIVIIIWFCTKHWIVASIGVLTLMLCISPIRTWFPMNSSKNPSPDAITFTILTWNTLHFADLEQPDTKEARTLKAILEVDADIVCLQEIFGFTPKLMKHYDEALLDSLFKKYPYQLGKGSYDLRILSKYPLRHIYFGSIHHFTLSEYFTVKIGDREIGMANVHLPSFALDENEKGIFSPHTGTNLQNRERLGKRIFRKFEYAIPIRAEAAEKLITGFEGLAMPIIICGDFNDVPGSWTYHLFSKAGYTDAYAETNFLPTYTFYPHGFYFHLDQIFYRGAITPLKVERLNYRTSDHLPLLATFELNKNPYPIKSPK